MGLWLSVFPTVETLIAQALALVLVLGSYFGARARPATRAVAIPAEPSSSTSPATPRTLSHTARHRAFHPHNL
jgi:hypothetical protein